MLYIKETPEMGRGVFTDQPIKPGDIVESCHVVVLPEDDLEEITKTVLNMYVFKFDEHMKSDSKTVIALGKGSLMNHSWDPNISYKQVENMLVFIATREIQPDEQLFINYGYDPQRGLDVYARVKEGKKLKEAETFEKAKNHLYEALKVEPPFAEKMKEVSDNDPVVRDIANAVQRRLPW